MAKDVTKGGNTEVMNLAMFEEDAGFGNENMGQDDLALPFLKIISGLDSILDTHETAKKVTSIILSAVECIKGRKEYTLFPWHINGSLFSGSPEDKALAHL